MYQYLPYLKEQGLEVVPAPLLDDDYVLNLYGGKKTDWGAVFRSYLCRLGQVVQAGRYDLLWIQWELFPWMPAWTEQLLRVAGIPYVVDFDDAIFHHYDQHRSPWVRLMLGRKIDQVMRSARCVVVGNPYLGARAAQAGARQVVEIPSVIDLNRYAGEEAVDPHWFTVGWIGTPVTFKFFRPILPALQELSQDENFQLVVIGANADTLEGVRALSVPWSEEGEVSEMLKFDVGIMPLSDDPWSRGKCGYKLIQYMACGRPVVASPVGVNSSIVEVGVNGFLATDPTEWVAALRKLQQDHRLRRQLGEAGRTKVENTYCLQVTASQLSECLRTSRRR
jgi:glycosyltransferase involved in cell wall biosynthesis